MKVIILSVMNSGSMSTLCASANYLWDTAKALGHGATSMVYFGRERVWYLIYIYIYRLMLPL